MFRFLVVDDEECIREFFKDIIPYMLEDFGSGTISTDDISLWLPPLGGTPTSLILFHQSKYYHYQDYKAIDNYTICTADNGRTAMEIVKEKHIDLVITNIRMPGMWGLELTRRIKEIYPNMPVVIITGYEKIDEIIEAYNIGVLDYWIKPFGPCEKFKQSVLNSIIFALKVKNKKIYIPEVTEVTKNVLIIENNYEYREILSRILKDDYFITATATGDETLKILETGVFSFVLINYIPPDNDLNLLELMSKIKALYPDIFIIMYYYIMPSDSVLHYILKFKLADYILSPWIKEEDIFMYIKIAIENLIQIKFNRYLVFFKGKVYDYLI